MQSNYFFEENQEDKNNLVWHLYSCIPLVNSVILYIILYYIRIILIIDNILQKKIL